MTGAYLRDADVWGAYYEKEVASRAADIAQAKNLGHLRFLRQPAAMVVLRKSLSDDGFLTEARQVNAGIHRHNESSVEYLFFDWTCAWGANWKRPLEIVGALSLICGFVYWIGMRFGGKSGLYLMSSGGIAAVGKIKLRSSRIAVRKPVPATSLKKRIHFELQALKTALLFSMMSVLNLGYQGFAFGSWIRMVQTREFDIKPYGWMKTVSGLQSILGVALVTLALLSYFGHPFD